jgi:hypothetical protein
LTLKPDDKKQNKQHEKLLKLKQEKGHCMVPFKHKQDKSLGIWVSTQQTFRETNQIWLDWKTFLDEIGFAWKADGDKLWHQQHEKIVEFKRKTGHCLVPRTYEQDKFLGQWVGHQRNHHVNDKTRPDQKELLERMGFAWKAHTLEAATHSRLRNRSPDTKRPKTRLSESGQIAATRANQRGKAADSCSSLETDGGLMDEEDSKQSPVTSSGGSALTASDPSHQVVQEEPTGSCQEQEVIVQEEEEEEEEEAPGDTLSGWKVLFPIWSSHLGNLWAWGARRNGSELETSTIETAVFKPFTIVMDLILWGKKTSPRAHGANNNGQLNNCSVEKGESKSMEEEECDNAVMFIPTPVRSRSTRISAVCNVSTTTVRCHHFSSQRHHNNHNNQCSHQQATTTATTAAPTRMI